MSDFTYISGRLTLKADLPGGATDGSPIAQIIMAQMDIVARLVELAHEEEKQRKLRGE